MSVVCIVRCSCPDREPVSGTHNYYKCGHRNGEIISLNPRPLQRIGRKLGRVYEDDPTQFEVFRKIAAWPRTDIFGDEQLVLSPDETLQWQLEIEQLRHYLSEEWVWWSERGLWQKIRAYEVETYRSQDWQAEDQNAILGDGLILCEASIRTGNPIDFLW